MQYTHLQYTHLQYKALKMIQACLIAGLCWISQNTIAATLLDIYRISIENSAQWQSFQIQPLQKSLQSKIVQAQLKPQIGFTMTTNWQTLNADSAQIPGLQNNDITALNQCLTDNNDYNFCLNQSASINCGEDLACLIGENGSDQKSNTTTYGLQLSQPLFDAALWYEAKQAQTQELQSKLQQRENQQLFLANLVKAYLLALSARETANANSRELEQQQSQLKLLEQQFEKGVVPASDVLYGRATLDLQRSVVAQKKRQVLDTFRALEALTQQPITELSNLRDDIPMPKPNPANVGQWLNIARQANPTLIKLAQETKISELEIHKRQGLRKPKVKLTAGIGSTTTHRSGSFEQRASASSAQVSLELALPLYSGGALKKSVSQAHQLKTLAKLQQQAEQERIFHDIEVAFNASAASFQHIQNLQKVIDSLILRLDNLEKGFENGIVPAQDVLEARAELLKTQKNKTIARFDYIQSSIDLKKQAGVLSEQDINVIASWSAAQTITGAQQTLFDQAKQWLEYEQE